jgi:hypothetical protein
MKKIIVASALALTATVAVASTQIHLRKVNKVIASVIQPELTPLIKAVEIKFDERSNLETVAKLKVVGSASATATESKWSKSPTTLDLQAGVKTLTTDATNTKLEVAASVGSKTEAVALYRYVAAILVKHEEYVGGGSETHLPSDVEMLAWLKVAAQTTTLDAIPNQLEQLIPILKLSLSENTIPDSFDLAMAKLVDSLKVESKVGLFKGREVILKTTDVVTVEDIVISNLALKISEKGLSLSGKVAFGVSTQFVTQFLDYTKETLTAVQNADAETLNTLRETAKSYIQLAEEFVKGEE